MIPEEGTLLVVAADRLVQKDIDMEYMTDGLVILSTVALDLTGDSFACQIFLR